MVVLDAPRMIANQSDLDQVLELAKDVLGAFDERHAELVGMRWTEGGDGWDSVTSFTSAREGGVGGLPPTRRPPVRLGRSAVWAPPEAARSDGGSPEGGRFPSPLR